MIDITSINWKSILAEPLSALLLLFSLLPVIGRSGATKRSHCSIYKVIAVRQQSDRRTRLAAAARDDGQNFSKREYLNSYALLAFQHFQMYASQQMDAKLPKSNMDKPGDTEEHGIDS
ncbi:MAG: hypothetical protein Q9P90_19800 [candidate division KSB1 bacterium]|nr:hypothetical protein [candidate division KSB1 bacterium]